METVLLSARSSTYSSPEINVDGKVSEAVVAEEPR